MLRSVGTYLDLVAINLVEWLGDPSDELVSSLTPATSF